MTGSRSSLIGALLIIFFHINQSQNKRLKIAIMALMLMSIRIILSFKKIFLMKELDLWLASWFI
jgi:hypothetical protein